jgi:hypothetical protein
MLFYHFTLERYLSSILKEGLLPRGKRKPTWGEDQFLSNPKMIYLTRYKTLKGLDIYLPKELIPVRLTINLLETNKLFPDEDLFDFEWNYNSKSKILQSLEPKFRDYVGQRYNP